MYARLCSIEILSSYIREITVGDTLTVRALVTNPLDWQHFYEMFSSLHRGDRTDFTVVTSEGDRIVGEGEISEFEKWSDTGRYGFLIKLSIRRQKSLTDRRIRGPPRRSHMEEETLREEQKEKPKTEKPAAVPQVQPRPAAAATATLTPRDIADFKDLLKDSLTMDMSA